VKIGHHVLPGAVTGDCAGWPLPVSAATPLTGCSITTVRRKRPRAEKAHRAPE
jgi:hypothetical protein